MRSRCLELYNTTKKPKTSCACTCPRGSGPLPDSLISTSCASCPFVSAAISPLLVPQSSQSVAVHSSPEQSPCSTCRQQHGSVSNNKRPGIWDSVQRACVVNCRYRKKASQSNPCIIIATLCQKGQRRDARASLLLAALVNSICYHSYKNTTGLLQLQTSNTPKGGLVGRWLKRSQEKQAKITRKHQQSIPCPPQHHVLRHHWCKVPPPRAQGIYMIQKAWSRRAPVRHAAALCITTGLHDHTIIQHIHAHKSHHTQKTHQLLPRRRKNDT